MRFYYRAALTIVLMFVLSAPGWAGPLFYSTGGSGDPLNSGTMLFSIDTTTGAGASVGPFGYNGVYSGAFSPDGLFIAVINSFSAGTELAVIDLNTGAATGLVPTAPSIYILQFSPGGILYASQGSRLYIMDTGTGLLTDVGAFGEGITDMMDFAMDRQGVLYGVASTSETLGSRFYRIDPGTAQATLLYASDTSCIMGLAFDLDGALYGTNHCLLNSPLYRIDLAAQSVAIVGMTGIPVPHGGDISMVPEPVAALTALSGLLLLLGLRRRR